MIHKDMVGAELHTIINWTVADAAARVAIVTVAADVGKIAFQTDTQNFYILADESPETWKLLTVITLTGADISLADAGSYFTTDNAEAALQQIGAIMRLQSLQFAVSDEITALTVGTNKIVIRAPFAFTLLAVRGSLTTAQATGGLLTVDVNKNGSTVISTKLTFDNTEKTSVSAATQPVISVTSFADDDEIAVDIDSLGDGTAKGLKITLNVSRT